MRKNHSSGFTLIEMLVVIAIVAILVAIIVPTVTSSTTKAKAATDAANLRSIIGAANVAIFGESKSVAEVCAGYQPPVSKLHPGCEMIVFFDEPGILEAYYVSGSVYYSVDYFSELASQGESSISTANPHPEAGQEHWFRLGTSK